MRAGRKQKRQSAVDFFAFIGRPVFLLIKSFFKAAFFLLFLVWQAVVWLGKVAVRSSRWLRRKAKEAFGLVKTFLGDFKNRFLLFRFSFRPGWKWFFLLGFLACLALFSWSIFKDLPRPERLITRRVKQTTRIYDRNGNLLYKVFRQQNRTLIPFEKIPLVVKEATIAIEDKDFYQHQGISLSGIGRALWRLLSQGKIEGGSTITQQLVKNTLLTPERTLSRKIKEIVLSFMVEASFSKEEILQMYLNEVGYGGAAYGVEEASQYYFGKPAYELNLAEAALLAGLPASPTTYSPFGAYPQLAKVRQREVLSRMEEEDFISPEAAKRAGEAEIRLASLDQNILAPHFVMFVKEELAKEFGSLFVEEGGLQVTTTLDLATQQLAERVVDEELAKLTAYRVTNGGVLVTSPESGEILAMVGSRDYFNQEIEGNFNVTTALRQPGSTIKVVNYALALENGYTLASQILDAPVSYQTPGQSPYRPVNYDNRFHGLLTLRSALACSYNVPAVKVLASLGVERMIELGREMGIESWKDGQQFGLSLTLGGGEVAMTDLATVYGVLANQGSRVPLQSVLAVHDHRGRLIWSNPCLNEIKVNPQTFAVQTEAKDNFCREQVISPQVAYLLTSVLADNQARAPVFGLNSVINIPGYQVAVKTGTTNNLRDNWTIGYSPGVLVASWVGNNDNSPMARIASGVTGASPIWRKIMEKLIVQKERRDFPVPEGIVSQSVCLSYDQERQVCQKEIREYFIAGENQGDDRLARTAKPEMREKLLPAQQDSR